MLLLVVKVEEMKQTTFSAAVNVALLSAAAAAAVAVYVSHVYREGFLIHPFVAALQLAEVELAFENSSTTLHTFSGKDVFRPTK